MNDADVKEIVNNGYGAVAKSRDPSDKSIVSDRENSTAVWKYSGELGYSDQEMDTVPETPLPFDLLIKDPMVKTIVANLKIPTEMVRDISSTFVSIKVCGIK